MIALLVVAIRAQTVGPSKANVEDGAALLTILPSSGDLQRGVKVVNVRNRSCESLAELTRPSRR